MGPATSTVSETKGLISMSIKEQTLMERFLIAGLLILLTGLILGFGGKVVTMAEAVIRLDERSIVQTSTLTSIEEEVKSVTDEQYRLRITINRVEAEHDRIKEVIKHE